jgi:hypothetical protein
MNQSIALFHQGGDHGGVALTATVERDASSLPWLGGA